MLRTSPNSRRQRSHRAPDDSRRRIARGPPLDGHGRHVADRENRRKQVDRSRRVLAQFHGERALRRRRRTVADRQHHPMAESRAANARRASSNGCAESEQPIERGFRDDQAVRVAFDQLLRTASRRCRAPASRPATSPATAAATAALAEQPGAPRRRREHAERLRPRRDRGRAMSSTSRGSARGSAPAIRVPAGIRAAGPSTSGRPRRPRRRERPRQIGRERALVGQLPQRRGLIAIAGGGPRQACDLELGMGRASARSTSAACSRARALARLRSVTRTGRAIPTDSAWRSSQRLRALTDVVASPPTTRRIVACRRCFTSAKTSASCQRSGKRRRRILRAFAPADRSDATRFG